MKILPMGVIAANNFSERNAMIVPVGTLVAQRPPDRSVRALLTHSMCLQTYYAKCGAYPYVAANAEPFFS
jgi:hypothetical protein